MFEITFLLTALIGLELGSFANVCIYRWPKKLSIIYPIRSECPWCKHTIPWWANIPILSFFLLKAKCHKCSSEISWRYPLVEFIVFSAGISFLLYLFFFSIKLPLVYFISGGVFIFTLIITAVTDLDWKIIPDEPLIFTLVLGIISAPWNPILNLAGPLAALKNSIFGVFMSSGTLFLITIFGKWILSRDAIGFGDVKLLGVMGAFLGTGNTIHVLLLGSILGGFFSLVAMKCGRLKRHQYIPFAPFLNIAAFLIFLRSINS